MAKGFRQVTQFIPALYVCLAIALIVAVAFIFHYRSLARLCMDRVALLEKQSSDAHRFARARLEACQLLSIHRNGRLNVFTFARNDDVFRIETMGLLSDTPDEWRKRAGLTQ